MRIFTKKVTFLIRSDFFTVPMALLDIYFNFMKTKNVLFELYKRTQKDTVDEKHEDGLP